MVLVFLILKKYYLQEYNLFLKLPESMKTFAIEVRKNEIKTA